MLFRSPGGTLTNNEADLTISGGVISWASPGDSGSGSGTFDPQTGEVMGTGTALNAYGQTLQTQVAGQAATNSTGIQFTGTWADQGTFSDGSSNMGSGTWIVQQSPGQLLVTSQPTTSVIAGQTFEVDIEALDSLGNLNTDFNGAITIAIANNAGNGQLGGTLTVNAVAGVAKFTDLTLSTPGAGYTLAATGQHVNNVTTGTFDVDDQLVVTVQPPESVPINKAFDVQVSAENASGAVDSAFNGPLTISLGNNPTSGTLGGTLTVDAHNGVADFSDLMLDTAGKGYTLQADGTGALEATTDAFDVTDFELQIATEPDPSHVLLSYHVDATNLSDPITLDIYRTSTPDSTDASDLLATTAISNPQNLTQGDHQIQLSLNGATLSIDPTREYVDVVADPDSSGQASDAAQETYFQKFVLGVATHGFELNGQAPAWLSQLTADMEYAGYNQAIAFNWALASLKPWSGVTVSEGSLMATQIKSVADSLVAQDGVAPGSVVDLHLIGHSRGSVVISQAMLDLVSTKDSALVGSFKEMTFLDPHPANSSDQFLSAAKTKSGRIEQTAYNLFVTRTNDPAVVIPSNVNQVEVFYQQNPVSVFPASSGESTLNLWGDVRDITNRSNATVRYTLLNNAILQDGSRIGHLEVPLYYLQNVAINFGAPTAALPGSPSVSSALTPLPTAASRSRANPPELTASGQDVLGTLGHVAESLDGGSDTVTDAWLGAQLLNPYELTVGAPLDSEAIDWAGLAAAVAILNSPV